MGRCIVEDNDELLSVSARELLSEDVIEVDNEVVNLLLSVGSVSENCIHLPSGRESRNHIELPNCIAPSKLSWVRLIYPSVLIEVRS